MPGPLAAANVSVGGDIAGAIATPEATLKELRKQIKAAEKELVELAKKGEKVSSQQAFRLADLKAKEKQTLDIVTRQKRVLERSKRALDAAEIGKAMFGASSLKNILAGNASMADVAGIAFMAERQIVKGAKELAGVKFARMTRGVLKAMPFLSEAVGSVIEGWQEKRALEEQMGVIGEEFRGGRISKAAEIRAQNVLTNTWFGKPAETLAADAALAASIQKIPDEKLSEALSNAKWISKSEVQKGSFGMGGPAPVIHTYRNLKEAGLLTALRENIANEQTRLGGSLGEKDYRDVVEKTINDIADKEGLDQKTIELLTKQIIKAAPMVKETTHRSKWEDARDNMRRQAEARKDFIPARLEY